jgi:hypothetical protein
MLLEGKSVHCTLRSFYIFRNQPHPICLEEQLQIVNLSLDLPAEVSIFHPNSGIIGFQNLGFRMNIQFFFEGYRPDFSVDVR